MDVAIIIVFVVGYLAIAFEHPLKVNKTASAIITGVLCWTLFMFLQNSTELTESDHYKTFEKILEAEIGSSTYASLGQPNIFHEFVGHELARHLASISEILFFLLGAMTIVELIDAHRGFKIITDKIKTQNPRALLWIICWIAFFLSAILDNLTTTIVMVSVTRKLISDRELKLLFIGMIILAANAGGAWTPMGDVTTTMLWIGNQVSTVNIIKTLLLPSIVCLLVPLSIVTLNMKSSVASAQQEVEETIPGAGAGDGKLMLIIGIGVLIGVPAFKVLTHTPPYIGMLLGLGIIWVVSELINPSLDDAEKKHFTPAGALSRIDVPSILFFLGILLAVGCLESMGKLETLAHQLDVSIGNHAIIISLIGIFSAVIDNVPLVAASIGMYSLDQFPTDHFIWEFLAYCAGTGGSILVIGSAAGVAAMGMEKIDFIWYLKKISWLALIGYASGAGVYLLTV